MARWRPIFRALMSCQDLNSQRFASTSFCLWFLCFRWIWHKTLPVSGVFSDNPVELLLRTSLPPASVAFANFNSLLHGSWQAQVRVKHLERECLMETRRKHGFFGACELEIRTAAITCNHESYESRAETHFTKRNKQKFNRAIELSCNQFFSKTPWSFLELVVSETRSRPCSQLPCCLLAIVGADMELRVIIRLAPLKHWTSKTWRKTVSFFNLRPQKGFLPGVAGCLEHSALLSETLRDRRAICVSWLDLRNAFGSVRHSLIQFALRHYGLPPHFQRLVFDYYERLFAIVDVPGEFQSKPFHFAIGVFQGCTLSPLLFNIVIQLLLDILEKPDLQSSAAGYRFSSLKDSLPRSLRGIHQTLSTNAQLSNKEETAKHVANFLR